MDTSVLKEPRGFMRCIQGLFAIVAFSTCCHFNTRSEYMVVCKKPNYKNETSFNVSHEIVYPFRIDHGTAQNVTCSESATGTPFGMYPPGDMVSDSQFFVFVGVASFLGSIGCLLFYVFCSQMYSGGDQKNAPMMDFIVSLMVAVFWLAASSAWANAVVTIKYVADPDNWIFSTNFSICTKDEHGDFVIPEVSKCEALHRGTFGEANASVVLGFLNVFLWASGLWFIYKETSWFTNRSQGGQQSQPDLPHQQMP